MKDFKKVCQNQNLVWEPSPIKNPVEMKLVEDGVNLSSSMIKNIESIGLCRHYSNAQLRRIKQLHKTKRLITKERKNNYKNPPSNKFPINRQAIIKKALNEEALL
jgi:hypothetical protein